MARTAEPARRRRRGWRLWPSATPSPDDAVARLLAFHRLLVEDPLAPTAVRDPMKAIDDHLADSLVALELEPIRVGRDARRPRVRRRRSRAAAGDRAARDERSRSSRAPRGNARSSSEPIVGLRDDERASSSIRAPRPGPKAWRLSTSSPLARSRRSRSSPSTRRRCWPSAARSSAWRGRRDPARRGGGRSGGGATRPRAGRNPPDAAISRRRKPVSTPHVEGYGDSFRVSAPAGHGR